MAKGFLATVQRIILLLLVLVVLFEGVLLWFHRDALNDERERSSDLEQEIRDMERAAALTERLREYNEETAQDRADIQREIEGAASYNDPLPSDILHALDRLRDAGETP